MGNLLPLGSRGNKTKEGYENKREKERAREAKQKEKGKQVRMISNRNYEWINIEKK